MNPNDLTSLNNKAVELSLQNRYNDAMKYFDKIIEIDPENVTVLHNKKMLEKKAKRRTVADYLGDYPQLEITEKEGKLILEIKE